MMFYQLYLGCFLSAILVVAALREKEMGKQVPCVLHLEGELIKPIVKGNFERFLKKKIHLGLVW